MTDDLIAFLNARLDEDEAAAKKSHYEGQRWLTEEEGVYRWPTDELVHSADRKADARHIARFDPARVLREVAAKRAIVAAHQPMEALYGGWRIDKTWQERGLVCTTCGFDDSESGVAWPCLTIRSLAAVYSDHDDYRQEWKPAA